MAEIKLTINGKKVTGKVGDTILGVCERNGIYIPTLCHHKRLKDTGACRLCIVEVEGARGYSPACSIQAYDGMNVRTETEEINKIRRTMLEFLFSERNHYCMFCEASGDCELQKLAYEHNIDHARYQYALPKVRVDSTRSYFVFDENRCILCQRCIRACSEIAGHNVLDLGRRGAETRIIADLNSVFGDSTCTSCGTCLQICPTGALIDRKSAYMGRMGQCETTKSVCFACSVGCGIEIITRDNHVLKINGDWDAQVNEGILCVAGRFEPLYNYNERLTKPMIKQNGTLSEIGWDEALDYAVKRFKGIGMSNIAGMISPRATNEEARLFADLFKSNKIREFGPDTILIEGRKAVLNDIRESDCILMYKIDLDEETRVVGSFVKLAVYQSNAKLILMDNSKNSFDRHATTKLFEFDQAKKLLDQASNPVIIYGRGASFQELENLNSEKAKMLGLLAGANSMGLRELGVNGKMDVQDAKALYVLACDDDLNGKFDRGNAEFVVLQTSYFTPDAEKADLILPSPIWAEKEGSLTNIDSITQKVTRFIEAPDGVQPNEVPLRILAEKLAGI